jgi:hypothetical protein
MKLRLTLLTLAIGLVTPLASATVGTGPQAAGLSIDDVAITEGNSGTATATFTVGR